MRALATDIPMTDSRHAAVFIAGTDTGIGKTHASCTLLHALRDAGLPVVLVVNQVDKQKDKTALLPFIAKVTDGREFAAVHPLSALKRSGLEPLVATLLDLMPDAVPMYGEDEITDKSQRFLAGEMVREQLMRRLGEELPYSTTVEVERFEEEPSPKTGVMYRIDAVIWVEREGQKAIVIGKGGERLRDIGKHAREQMERLFDAKVFLQTWVRVREGWLPSLTLAMPKSSSFTKSRSRPRCWSITLSGLRSR